MAKLRRSFANHNDIIMSPSSIVGFSDTSPFLDVQARDIPAGTLASDFYPTSTFWNLFTSGHQVLLGTRGSGKTALIRMLSYGCLRLLSAPKAKTFVREKRFLGFYVPLHLEQMTLITQNDDSYESRVGYFKFIFNHIAAAGFIETLAVLLEDMYPNPDVRIEKEIELSRAIILYWYGPRSKVKPMLASIMRELRLWAYRTERWQDGLDSPGDTAPPLCKPCLDPVVAVIPEVNSILELNPQVTQWVACIDEAEFLKPPFLKAINTFMRSQNRGLVVRLATAPFRYERDTEIPDAPLEPNGNDFRYVVVDMEPESREFEQLCEFIWNTRSKRFGNIKATTLAEFLQDDLDADSRAVYGEEFGSEALTHESLLAAILAVVSPQRAASAKRRLAGNKDIRKPYINKYSPVLFLRRLKTANDKGNTNVGLYAGARICRLVSEGNPRRFLDLMHLLYERHRSSPLTRRVQQDVILSFCCSVLSQSDGLPEHGPLVRSILDCVLGLLESRVHGATMLDGGCSFAVSANLLKNAGILEALKTAVRFSRLTCEDPTAVTINPDTTLRISYSLAPTNWIPMREGDRPTLYSSSLLGGVMDLPRVETPALRRSASDGFVRGLELAMEDAEDEELSF